MMKESEKKRENIIEETGTFDGNVSLTMLLVLSISLSVNRVFIRTVERSLTD